MANGTFDFRAFNIVPGDSAALAHADWMQSAAGTWISGLSMWELAPTIHGIAGQANEGYTKGFNVIDKPAETFVHDRFNAIASDADTTYDGAKLADTLTGSFSDDTISGGGGADTLAGGAGDDTICADGTAGASLLTIRAYGLNNGTALAMNVIVNGATVAANQRISATQGSYNTVSADLSAIGTVSSFAIACTNDNDDDGRTLYVANVWLNGYAIPMSWGTRTTMFGGTIAGDWRMYDSGTLNFDTSLLAGLAAGTSDSVHTVGGGAGNDALHVGDLVFSALDGGTGTDTLALDRNGMTLDLSTISDPSLTSIVVVAPNSERRFAGPGPIL